MAITLQNLLPILIIVLRLKPIISIVIFLLARISNLFSKDQVYKKDKTEDWEEPVWRLAKANVILKTEVLEKSIVDIEL